ALAGRRHRTALSRVCAGEDAVGGYVVPLMIGRERLDLVATVRDEAEESLHPVGVVLQRANIGERFGLRREAGIWLTVSTARLPALAGLAGIEECLRRLGDRLCFSGGRHDRPLISKNRESPTPRSHRAP